MRSRLAKTREKQTKKSLVFNILGIAITLFLLIKFGLPLLANVTLFISGSHNAPAAQEKKSASFVSPPVFDALPDATNSAHLSISGAADKHITVELYINSELVSKSETDDQGKFIFDNIKLNSGTNEIKSKAVTSSKDKSDFSNEVLVIYQNNPPSLSVDSPTDQQSFVKDESPIKVSGKTDVGNKVTVNNLWAIVDDQGNYSYNLPLQNGDNNIKVIATDPAGNATTVERKVKYSQ